MNSVDQFQEWITSHSKRTEVALEKLLDSAQTQSNAFT
jgi:farnesyl diphosphate synthase